MASGGAIRGIGALFALAAALGAVYYYAQSSPGVSKSAFAKVPKSGAEDADLWTLRGAAFSWQRIYFDTFSVAMMANPRAAMVGARLAGGTSLDVVMFGSDEAAAKSPFSWLHALVAPGLLAARYTSHFQDTNFWLATLQSINYAATDIFFLTKMAGALLFTQADPLALLQDEAWRTAFGLCLALLTLLFTTIGAYIWGSVAAIISFFSFPLTWTISTLARAILPKLLFAGLAKLCTAAFYDNCFFALSVSAFAAWNVFWLGALALELLVASKLKRSSSLDAAKQRAVLEAVQSKVPLFLTTPWEKLYEQVTLLGAGGFGAVYSGTVKTSGMPCAIKHFHPEESSNATPEEKSKQKISAALLAFVRKAFTPAGLKGGYGAAQKVIADFDEGSVAVARMKAVTEVTALRAVKALASPNFIDLLSAHQSSPENFTVITSLAGPTFQKALPALPEGDRLVALQRACSAIADLHSAGMVHRDIKWDNFATRLDDLLSPIVLDLGLLRLPAGVDDLEGACYPYAAPPEFWKEALVNAAVVDRPVEYYQARDVFAMGLMIAEVLYGQNPLELAFLADPEPDLAVFVKKWTAEQARGALEGLGASGAMLDLLASMLAPLPVQRPTMAEVAAHAVFPATAGVPPRRPTASQSAGAPAGVHFDTHSPRGILHRMHTRHNRLALLREISRLASEDASAAGLPPNFMSRLHEALGGRAVIAKGKEFDDVLERAGLSAALPIDHNDLFAVLDADESGAVDKREFLAGMAFLLAPSLPRAQQLQLVFEAFDADGSGELSKSELTDMLEAFGVPALTSSVKIAAARACAAPMHSLSLARAQPCCPLPTSHSQPPTPTAKHARNKKTFVEEMEVAKLFASLDKNGDGKISLKELAEGLQGNAVLNFDQGAFAGSESGAAANPTLTRRR